MNRRRRFTRPEKGRLWIAIQEFPLRNDRTLLASLSPDCSWYQSDCSRMSATAASLRTIGQSEVFSPASSPFPKRANKPFLANLRYGKVDLRSLRSRNQVLFEISQATLLVLTNQLADVFTGSAPIAGGDFLGALRIVHLPLKRTEFGQLSEIPRVGGYYGYPHPTRTHRDERIVGQPPASNLLVIIFGRQPGEHFTV